MNRSMLRRPNRSAKGERSSAPTTYPARFNSTGSPSLSAARTDPGGPPGTHFATICVHVWMNETVMSKMS